ncbi:dirigent protein 1-like [Phragmites australis]|uniref:dirigent protein 1-like n=1 Tax=Phragmites australis TaxID=29695 RepID=UPI002D772757|nr:dirigent protein 1-like [Phragmites australis]
MTHLSIKPLEHHHLHSLYLHPLLAVADFHFSSSPAHNPSIMAAMAAALLVILLFVAPAAHGTTHLNFFMHDIVTGSNPTAVQVIKVPGSSTAPSLGMSFGDTSVMDDLLTETSSATSAAVGRMQGFYMLSSQSGAVLMVCGNLLLTSGDYNGSTIAVMGRDDTAADVRELAVVGGTGKFRMASGYVLWKTSSMNGPDATVELDLYVSTSNDTTTIDGDGGSGSKATSGAVRVYAGGWVNACVVAVVVAVVGSYRVW